MGVKVSTICFNCGVGNIVDVQPVVTNGKIEVHFVCQNCGALNLLVIDAKNLNDTEKDWLCDPPTGFEWTLPAGKIVPIVGDPIYVSAFGEHLSRKAYLEKYKVDPEIAYRYMRRKKVISMANDMPNSEIENVPGNLKAKPSDNRNIEVLCKNCGAISELKLVSRGIAEGLLDKDDWLA